MSKSAISLKLRAVKRGIAKLVEAEVARALAGLEACDPSHDVQVANERERVDRLLSRLIITARMTSAKTNTYGQRKRNYK